MTKQLLYIPAGTYVTFYHENDTFSNIEVHCAKWSTTPAEVVARILDGTFNDTFYERNVLPNRNQLSPNHFEVVDK